MITNRIPQVPVEVEKMVEVEKIVEVEKLVYVEKNLTEGTVCSCKPGFYSADAGALVAFSNHVSLVFHLCRCCEGEATNSVNQTLQTENPVPSDYTWRACVVLSCKCRRRKIVQQVSQGATVPGAPLLHLAPTMPSRIPVSSPPLPG